jgi:hypothetical protein
MTAGVFCSNLLLAFSAMLQCVCSMFVIIIIFYTGSYVYIKYVYNIKYLLLCDTLLKTKWLLNQFR